MYTKNYKKNEDNICNHITTGGICSNLREAIRYQIMWHHIPQVCCLNFKF
jgi:hypothetical protein